MNLHEYQAKEILALYGIAVPRQFVISSKEEAFRIIEKEGLCEGVVKIQVHAGGRGKAGGVKVAKEKGKLLEYAGALLGMKLQNEQTGAHTVIAHKVLIGELVDYISEFYLSLLIDRAAKSLVFIISPEGGMEIEKVAEEHPEKILKIEIAESGRLRAYQVQKLCQFMGWKGALYKEADRLLRALIKVFIEKDASLIEINPLVLDHHQHLIALDAKISIDDNALFRHPDLVAMDDPTQIPDAERRAKEHDLSYVALDGTIGCMVNGAGLAMATMDIIKYYGGDPANFLDVGGGATKEKVAEGFRIILGDSKVEAIFVNIFGGIVSCKMIAEGVIAAAKEVKLHIPLVVRLEGTHVEEGKALLAQSGLDLSVAKDLAEGARLVVEAAQRSRS